MTFRRKPLVRSSRKRPQRVRFRSRYVSSQIKSVAKRAWRFFVHVGLMGAAGAAVWGGVQLWQTSSAMRVTHVQFSGEVPPQVKDSLSSLTGKNIFSLHTGTLQADILRANPELKKITVTRLFNRGVAVHGVLRDPLLYLVHDGRLKGVDASGVEFNRPEGDAARVPRPSVLALIDVDIFKKNIPALFNLSQNAPDFYRLIREIKTDRMARLSLDLSNGVLVEWGELDDSTVLVRAERIMALLKKFKPVKTPATLRFVTDDRIVMDSNWKPI